ncbi:hypothetical protein, partial [Terribacillus sp. AE2B 122]
AKMADRHFCLADHQFQRYRTFSRWRKYPKHQRDKRIVCKFKI